MKVLARINEYFKECFEKSQTFIGIWRINDIDPDVVNRITKLIPKELTSYINDDNYTVYGSVGKGLVAKTPWIAILDKEITTSARMGVYIAFLFSSDYKHVYLTLNQGTTIPGQFGARLNEKDIVKRTQEIREYLNIENDLLSTDHNAKIADKRYLDGAIYYSLWNESDNERGRELLQLYLDIYQQYKSISGQYESISDQYEGISDQYKGLHFEVQLKKGLLSDHAQSIANPTQFPSFVLVFNNGWNDYSYRTRFCLYYYGEDKVQRRIGEFKLMCRGEINTFNVLDKEFDGALSDDFCSLGLNPSYYSEIYDLFKDDPLIFDELLDSLRDCAYNLNIYEEFKEDDGFKKSLLREDSSSQAYVDAPYLLRGKDVEAFAIDLHFAPKYLNGAYTEWRIELLYDAPPFMRAVGLIGDNGVGKTQMIKHLIELLISPKCPFRPLPLFRSCLAISSTPLDNYGSIKKDPARIPFHYFYVEQNLKNTEEEIVRCIDEIYRRPLIYEQHMIDLYKTALDNILGKTIGNILVFNKKGNTYKLNKNALHDQINIMSSGQLHIFELLTFIHAHIKLSSLLIIDEPEVHMHPQFIVLFMAMLGHVLHQFRSYVVVATHSPLVVREMVGQNVYLMKIVEGNIPNVGKVGFETFGADASELYMNIFNYDECISSFYYHIKKLGKQMSYDEAIEYIMQFAPKLSLNARLSIRDYLEQEKDA